MNRQVDGRKIGFTMSLAVVAVAVAIAQGRDEGIVGRAEMTSSQFVDTLSTLTLTGPGMAARGEEGGIATVEIVEIPGFEVLTESEIAAIRAETAGRGVLILEDGDVIQGRVLAEGILVLPGATVFYDDDTEIVSMGHLHMLLGSFEPVFRDVTEPGGLTSSLTEASTPPGFCPTLNSPPKKDGKTAPFFRLTLVPVAQGIVSLDADAGFASICAGPHADQIPPPKDADGNPEDLVVTGTRSASATAGNGGNARSIEIKVQGTLQIMGTVCNGAGAPGGNAVAIGVDGPNCGDCGGDAVAKGGRGGDAGDLTISAKKIEWTAVPLAKLLSVQNGGRGGDAKAEGGNGGDCNTCGKGGRGGRGTANGGDAGKPGRIRIRAGEFDPAPANILSNSELADGATGGDAWADGGHGGFGGDCPCGKQGGGGGNGADARAIGGDGGNGYLFSLQVGADTFSAASNGGDGGWALRARGGHGGDAGDSGNCPCDYQPGAKSGGRGGQGGSGFTRGGKGGNATGAVPAGGLVTAKPKAGDGGSAATATCGVGGLAGHGGSCVGDETPILCKPGGKEKGGKGGKFFSEGGRPGKNDNNADPGSKGSPDPAHTGDCPGGDDLSPAQAGEQKCKAPPPPCENPNAGDCCLPNSTPGCKDGECCFAVCATDPFCCDGAWDAECSMLAANLCPWLDCGAKPGTCPWDLNGDGIVDEQDAELLIAMFGPCNNCENCLGDFNGDCVIDLLDLQILMANFGPCKPGD